MSRALSGAPRHLIVGADGLIGAALCTRLASTGPGDVLATTRRPDPRSPAATVTLDLGEDLAGHLPACSPEVVFLCAAVSGFAACENAPQASRRVNVESPETIVREFLDRGSFVVFLSTSAVFDGLVPHPGEDAATCPTNEYGRQKAAAERRLIELGGSDRRVAVVRLTKVVSMQQPLLGGFAAALRDGRRCEAFTDLSLSPVSLDYVLAALLALARRRLGGVFHLSGEDDTTWHALIGNLAAALGADPAAVHGVSAIERGVRPIFAPRHAALGMHRTTAQLGILPQRLDDVVAALAAEH